MIEINNYDLEQQLMLKLNKIDNTFTKEELDLITEIFLDTNSISGDYVPIDFNVVKNFQNLRSVTISNSNVDSNDILLLLHKKLKEVLFNNCVISSPTYLKNLNVTKLGIINCNIEDYSFIKSMPYIKQLSIINDSLDLENLLSLENLTFLEISNCHIINEKLIDNFLNLEILFLNDTNVDLSQINFNKLTKLSKLVISKDMTSYKKILSSLTCDIFIDDMCRYSAGDYNG